MHEFNTGIKMGLFISLVAMIMMIILSLLDRHIPQVISAIFAVGFVVSLGSSLVKQ